MYGMKEILTVVGAFMLFVGFCLTGTWAMLWWDRRRVDNGYDERQMLHRGRGTMLGFWTMIFFNFAVALWEVLEPQRWDAGQVSFYTMVLGGMVTVTYFMITDSWAKYNEKTWWVVPVFIFSGAAQIWNFIMLNESLLWQAEKGLESAHRTDPFRNLLVGLGMIYYGVLHCVCHWWHNRE